LTAPAAIIDDPSRPPPHASGGAARELIADRGMGGHSSGTMRREAVAGRAAIRRQGEVSLANTGGFLQIALNLAPGGASVDANRWGGVEVDVFGNGERYSLHLRTTQSTRPGQSWRRGFVAAPNWQTLRLTFAGFAPHRIDAPLDLKSLRRIGIVAIGRAFGADIAVGSWLPSSDPGAEDPQREPRPVADLGVARKPIGAIVTQGAVASLLPGSRVRPGGSPVNVRASARGLRPTATCAAREPGTRSIAFPPP
jgi:hypothetical protein